MGTDIQGLGHLAVPAAGSGPGVLVLQEWWGLVPHIRSMVDRFAEAGDVALAPDLYQGETTTSPDEAGRLFMALNIEQTAVDLEAAVTCLLNLPEVIGDRLGVVGFCMGGQLALLAATVSDRIGAVVDFYGIHPNVKPNFAKLTAPVLGIFGEKDAFVPPDAVQVLVSAIQTAGGDIEHTYTPVPTMPSSTTPALVSTIPLPPPMPGIEPSTFWSNTWRWCKTRFRLAIAPE